MTLRIVLPWSTLCSVNQRTNPIRGRQFLTKRYRAALSNASVLVMGQVRGERPRFTGPVRVTFDFFPPDRRRRDCGNFTKLVEDAMTDIVYADDSQVHEHTVRKMYVDLVEPRVEVSVEPLEASEAA